MAQGAGFTQDEALQNASPWVTPRCGLPDGQATAKFRFWCPDSEVLQQPPGMENATDFLAATRGPSGSDGTEGATAPARKARVGRVLVVLKDPQRREAACRRVENATGFLQGH